jgi:hypothetical protein
VLQSLKQATLPVTTITLCAGLFADYNEVLSAASLPYPLLVAVASSCLCSLEGLKEPLFRIRAAHSLAEAIRIDWIVNVACHHLETYGVGREIRGVDEGQVEDVMSRLQTAIHEAKECDLATRFLPEMQLTLAAFKADRAARLGPPSTHAYAGMDRFIESRYVSRKEAEEGEAKAEADREKKEKTEADIRDAADLLK